MEICKAIEVSDVSGYAWNRLSQYYNVEYVAERLCRLHGLDGKQKSNAKKQAEQIRYCLIQAREYYSASNAVSLSTKPVLLYYCCMSLALAEILFKQTGKSRLSELRAHHNCHGLQLAMTGIPEPKDFIFAAASMLKAKAQVKSSGPNGTFEVWRRSAREYPLVGDFDIKHASGGSRGAQCIFVPEDYPPPPLPAAGVSLYEMVSSLPYMSDVLIEWGARPEMISVTVSQSMDSDKKGAVDFVVHPNDQDLIDSFGDMIKFPASSVNLMAVTEYPSGYALRWPAEMDISIPQSMNIGVKRAYFPCNSFGLNEFGYIYIALHILGNFARYYPDSWVKHIELNSSLACIAESLCSSAMSRLPLLSLSELSETYHVLAD
ncbi:YaaC family protein [Pseudomonas sp. PDM33]|uniref:YaaC family protein n=1 Tax=Pseudomonas sp. PDM33 TaxID=2854765 RepID=UPI001C453284|nr:YaaC family protein [Pseudomonas sp. PDM33]MBV7582155.1 YaaC family protein [Pseudomonas sp. PDM33]